MAAGFTGVNVWNKAIDVIFQNSKITEGFLYIQISDATSKLLVFLPPSSFRFLRCFTHTHTHTHTHTAQKLLADNWFFPANFTNVTLPHPNITTSSFTQDQSGKSATVRNSFLI